LLTNSKTSSPKISLSTIMLRISNFNMVVLTSNFNYLHGSSKLEQFMLIKKKRRECLWCYLQVQNKFDVVKYIRFLPPILEKDVDKYFFFILRKLLKVWLRPMNTGPYFYRVPWQGKPNSSKIIALP
jgi:hypothetical protein